MSNTFGFIGGAPAAYHQSAPVRAFGLCAVKLTADEVREERAYNKAQGVTRLFPKLAAYQTATNAAGRAVLDNGDDIAALLRGCDSLAEVWAIAEIELGSAEIEVLAAKYKGLNPGMQRMNLGNKIRGKRAKALRAA